MMSIARIKVPGADFSDFGISPVKSRFDPLSMGAMVQGSFSAKDGSRLSLNAGRVASWLDRKSAVPLHDGGRAGARPTYLATGWGVTIDGEAYEFPCMQFDGISNGNALRNDNDLFATTQSVFMVLERAAAQSDGTNASQRPFVTTGRAPGSYYRYAGGVRPSSDASQSSFRFGGSVGTTPVAAGVFPHSVKTVAYVCFKPDIGVFGFNGSLAQHTYTEVESPATSYFSVGGQFTLDSATGTTPDLKFAGKIAEVLVLNGEPDADTRRLIEGHLAWEWGIASNLIAGHPYRSVSPGQ